MSKKNHSDTTGKCCTGIEYLTPASVRNNPGLSSLVYRAGTHHQFKRSMQAGISSLSELKPLTSRDDDDPTMALTDAWATVLDILTFYQERIANEGYLGTATERRSVLELSQHLGYQLNPGVSAGTFLAFTMDEAEGAPGEAIIPSGTSVQSIPGQDESPQIFETSEEIKAYKEWNKIRPRLVKPQDIGSSTESIVLNSSAANLQPGDVVMILKGSAKYPKKIIKVTIDAEKDTTRIDFVTSGPSLSFLTDTSLPEGSLEDLENEDELNGEVIDIILSKKWNEETLSAIIKNKEWPVDELNNAIKERLSSGSSLNSVFAFRKQVFAFGYNAPKQITCNDTGDPNPPALWVEWGNEEAPGKLYLDSAYKEILPGSYLVVQQSGTSIEDAEVYSATEVSVKTRSEYGLSSQTTYVELSPQENWWGDANSDFSKVRESVIYGASEKLEMADAPIGDDVSGKTIVLNGPFTRLKSGQRIIVTGERADLEGIFASETRIISEVTLEAGLSVIELDDPLDHTYVRESVVINGNVAAATHGETKTEIPGSGNGTRTFQQFQLKQAPLTYISSDNPGGSESTLEVRVNDVLWKEVPTLYGASPKEKVYITRIADDGTVTVMFGDGVTGARLPTGTENVKATYRAGIGIDGLLAPGQLSLLLQPQLGVKSVINNLAPTGADDPEEMEEAKTNAPMTVLSMERIVSLQDYEDFTRSFSGIGKAIAGMVWNGKENVIHITISSADGKSVDESSDLYTNLVSAIDRARHKNHPLEIGSFNNVYFDVKVKILVNEDYLADDVINEVKEKLLETFGFSAREFGQDVTPSEVINVIQDVDGVDAVDLDKLGGEDPFEKRHFRLSSQTAYWDGEEIRAAEMLVINPGGIKINEMTS
jgi:hypothetical protein